MLDEVDWEFDANQKTLTVTSKKFGYLPGYRGAHGCGADRFRGQLANTVVEKDQLVDLAPSFLPLEIAHLRAFSQPDQCVRGGDYFTLVLTVVGSRSLPSQSSMRPLFFELSEPLGRA